VAERDFLDGIAGGEAEGKTGAHYAGNVATRIPFQIEFLDGARFCSSDHFRVPLERHCRARDEDAEEADANADENREAGGVPQPR